MLKLAIAADEPCKVVNAGEMFKQLGVETLDLRKLDMSQCVCARQMFDECTSLKTLKQNWDLSNVVDGQDMFHNCRALTELDTSNWNLSKLENGYRMFQVCESLGGLDTSKWDLSHLQNARAMFDYCQVLSEIDTSDWDLSNVTDTKAMFNNCVNLTRLSASNWGLNTVSDAMGMFYGCRALTAIIGSGSWDLSSVTRMRNMFQDCPSLTELDASDWKLTALQATYTDIQTGYTTPAAQHMFNGSGLTKLTINGQALKKLIAAGAIDIDRQQYGSEEISEFYNAIMTFTGSVQGKKFIITGLEKYRARDGDWEYPAVDSDEEM